MNTKTPRVESIPGWFTKTDQLTFSVLLKMQLVEGDILEIGVFKGKSAVYLEYFRKENERLYVCDIFEHQINDAENENEIKKSYEGLSYLEFKKNFLLHHKNLPEIQVCDSKALSVILDKHQFRFIHIDGSHLFELVRSDLDFAISAIREIDGIIAVDDFRSAHTVGVSAAMWESVIKRSLVPIVITSTKAYLARVSNKIDMAFLERQLVNAGLEIEHVEIGNAEFLRVVDKFNGFESHRFAVLSYLLPPALYSFLRGFRNFLFKRR
jgi:hypothetical protein